MLKCLILIGCMAVIAPKGRSEVVPVPLNHEVSIPEGTSGEDAENLYRHGHIYVMGDKKLFVPLAYEDQPQIKLRETDSDGMNLGFYYPTLIGDVHEMSMRRHQPPHPLGDGASFLMVDTEPVDLVRLSRIRAGKDGMARNPDNSVKYDFSPVEYLPENTMGLSQFTTIDNVKSDHPLKYAHLTSDNIDTLIECGVADESRRGLCSVLFNHDNMEYKVTFNHIYLDKWKEFKDISVKLVKDMEYK